MSERIQNMTWKQGSFLFRLTGRKFWEPEQRPPPTLSEATALIGFCLSAIDGDEAARTRAVDLARKFFPDFQGSEIRKRFFRGKKKTPQADGEEHKAPEAPRQEQQTFPEHEPESKVEQPEVEHEPEPEEHKEEPEQEEEEKPEVQPEEDTKHYTEDTTADEIRRLIDSGIRNLWLYGPAGCGKTTLCKLVGAALDMPVTILSCSAGTSPGEFTGFRFPTPTPSAITEAIQQPGIIVLDEMPMLSPDVAAVGHALMSNGEMETVVGHRVRHADCVIIATANTTGDGGDRQYCGNNQLDGATLDRFACAYLRVDYSRTYEREHYPAEVCEYVEHLRDVIKRHNLRRIASTRAIINASKIMAAFPDWKERIVATWTDDEKALI